MNEQEFAELSAAAALHALSPQDERRYRRLLAEHPQWQEAAEADAATAARLALTTDPVRPPDGIRSALLDQIAAMPQGPDLTVDEVVATTRPKASRLARILFALAASVALLVGAGVGAVLLNNHLNRPAAVIALEEIQAAADAQQSSVELDGGGTATAHWSASLGTAVLVADGIAVPTEGEAYELWFVRGDKPVSAGVFAVEDGSATAVLDGAMHAGDVIAVTVEQAGGSPSGLPTSDPVIVIPTA